MAKFKFKVVFSTETEVEADNLAEAKGVIKGLAAAQMRGFKLERMDPMTISPGKKVQQ